MNPAVFERATVRALMTLPGPVLARFAAGLETHMDIDASQILRLVDRGIIGHKNPAW